MAKQVPARNGGTLTRPDKGETMNPNGRPRKLVSGTIVELREMGIPEVTSQEIKAVYLSLINSPIGDLEEMLNDQSQPALVKIVIQNILGNKGYEIIETMLDRSLGKAKQSFDIEMESKIEIDYKKLSTETLKEINEATAKN